MLCVPEAAAVTNQEAPRKPEKAGRPILANPLHDEVLAQIGRRTDIQPHSSEWE